mmetsp:Transcript_8450/g.38104  ORF Transcript_8450/g.38104 Transcript_8450/m.38104 type:complete len:296 (+) Transcript_8450:684-1571(+)
MDRNLFTGESSCSLTYLRRLLALRIISRSMGKVSKSSVWRSTFTPSTSRITSRLPKLESLSTPVENPARLLLLPFARAPLSSHSPISRVDEITALVRVPWTSSTTLAGTSASTIRKKSVRSGSTPRSFTAARISRSSPAITPRHNLHHVRLVSSSRDRYTPWSRSTTRPLESTSMFPGCGSQCVYPCTNVIRPKISLTKIASFVLSIPRDRRPSRSSMRTPSHHSCVSTRAPLSVSWTRGTCSSVMSSKSLAIRARARSAFFASSRKSSSSAMCRLVSLASHWKRRPGMSEESRP